MASYHGNLNLKPVGYQHDFTEQEIAEIARCIKDPIYFIESYCKVVSLDRGLIPFELYDFQKEKIDLILSNRRVIIMEPRQQGKTIVAAACILWYTIFQENKTVAIIANKGSAAREVLDRYQIMFENLPLWLQQGVKTWNKGNIDLENGSKIFTSATTTSSVKGRSINWLYIDETAAIPNTLADEFFASAYPTISSGETTKVLLTSTPLGLNHFWRYWNEAKPKDGKDSYYCDGTPGKNGFTRLFIPYSRHPDRDAVWAEGQRKLLGDTKFAQEVDCEFLGSSNTLINGKTLRVMSSIAPLRSSMDLDVYEEPKEGRFYCLCADTSYGVLGDYSAFVVVDATEIPYKLVAKYRSNKILPLLYPSVINTVGRSYYNAHILLENNDIGKQVLDILYNELEYENVVCTISENGKTYISPGFATTTQLGVKSNKIVKRQGCFALKSLLEEQKFPIFDATAIHELSTFTEKNGSFSADDGSYDDVAIALVLFAWMSTNQYFTELTNVSIREKIYAEQQLQIEEGLTPFLLDDGRESDEESDGEVLWTRVTSNNVR
jgi:hypothetical protein